MLCQVEVLPGHIARDLKGLGVQNEIVLAIRPNWREKALELFDALARTLRLPPVKLNEAALDDAPEIVGCSEWLSG